jgi:hypothetical protein
MKWLLALVMLGMGVGAFADQSVTAESSGCFLLSGTDKQIEDWAKNKYQVPIDKGFIVNKTKVKIIGGDYAFGRTLYDIYIYVHSNTDGKWTLLSYFKSKAENITVKSNEKNAAIQFYDEKDRLIYQVPYRVIEN